jgi:hypothetical protein
MVGTCFVLFVWIQVSPVMLELCQFIHSFHRWLMYNATVLP